MQAAYRSSCGQIAPRLASTCALRLIYLLLALLGPSIDKTLSPAASHGLLSCLQVQASGGFILARSRNVDLAQQHKLLQLLSAAREIQVFPGLECVRGDGTGYWKPQRPRKDPVPLSDFIASSLAVEMASDELASTWNPQLDSRADVGCFREALAVNLPSHLQIRYDPELDTVRPRKTVRLLGDDSSSLISSARACLPRCEFRNDAGDSDEDLDYELGPLVTSDASACSIMSPSAVSQSDDWCGRCIRSQLGNSLTMLRAVDIGVVIVSEMGTCVPWHVEDSCRSSQFLPSVQIDHAFCANRVLDPTSTPQTTLQGPCQHYAVGLSKSLVHSPSRLCRKSSSILWGRHSNLSGSAHQTSIPQAACVRTQEDGSQTGHAAPRLYDAHLCGERHYCYAVCVVKAFWNVILTVCRGIHGTALAPWVSV